MIHITIICLGKLKEKHWRSAEAEYLKRLTPFAKIEIKELKEESFDEKDDPMEVKKREAEKIKKVLVGKTDSHIIVLDEHGDSLSSKQLADKFSNFSNKQINNFIFILGGPLGLDEYIKKIADTTLSLSALTFTHQMARVILLEQIYRAMMINAGKKYHY